MRIAWCTPLSRRSAIGAVSAAVVEELARLASVEVFHPRTTDPFSVGVPIWPRFDGSEEACEPLVGFDAVVYCMGDSPTYHRAIYEASQRVPGVVVLHDLVLHHFFSALWLGAGGPERYFAELEQRYGITAMVAARESFEATSQWEWTPAEPETTPLVEVALRRALGVVTHSQHAAARVRECFVGPVTAVPLPSCRAAQRLTHGASSPMTILSIGHVNRNRHLDVVLDALASSPRLRAGTRYVVAGPVSSAERDRVDAAITERGLDDVVELRGHVDDRTLDRLLGTADVCVNLRHPVWEAASASLVGAMIAGLPALVVDEGHYAEIPADLVVAVPAPPTAAAVRAALEYLLAEPDERRARGARAATWARERHRVDAYAAHVLEFLSGPVAAERPILELSGRLSCGLERIGARGDSPVVGTAARVVDELFLALP